MIRRDEINTAWWGLPVATVTDAAWFEQDPAMRLASLAPYAWAEFKAPLAAAPPAWRVHDAGFALVDMQINFRVGLHGVRDSPSLGEYDCDSAAEMPFRIMPGEVRDFGNERFLQIPGATLEMINDRYVDWANQLVSKQPEWCLRLTYRGRVQGWFLSQFDGVKLHLVLAMLERSATVPGQTLYQRALREFSRRGAAIGHAAFSVRNTAVLNIYAHLGAQFLRPTGCWLWVDRERKAGTEVRANDD